MVFALDCICLLAGFYCFGIFSGILIRLVCWIGFVGLPRACLCFELLCGFALLVVMLRCIVVCLLGFLDCAFWDWILCLRL